MPQFADGIFEDGSLSDDRVAGVLRAAVADAAGPAGPYDILRAAIAEGDAGVLAAFSTALVEGVRLRDLIVALGVLSRAGPGPYRGQERFSAAAISALNSFSAESGAGLEHLLACVLEQLDAGDRGHLAILDTESAARLLRERARAAGNTLPPAFDEESGGLRPGLFTTAAWAVLGDAGRRAAELGYQRILPPHCFLALLAMPGGLTERLIRLLCRPPAGPAQLMETATAAFRLSGDPVGPPLPLHRDALGEPLRRMLLRAQRSARATGSAGRVGIPELLSALLDEPTPRLVSVLRAAPFRLEPGRLQERLDRMIRESHAGSAGATGGGVGGVGGVGDTGSDALERSLSAAVVGQREAVEVAVRELRRIRAGLSAGRGAASVMLFAGLTGVGKSELAKSIAKLHSSSGQPHIYSMANFTDPQSLSALLGPPPGYAGHDQGGRLVNDLNADPAGVFLLDEAEKAHPEIWGPFLHLFDEGTVTDRRGVTASSEQAIFILTCNAGSEVIAEMHREGRPEREISLAVEQTLRSLRDARSATPVFPPELLARIRHIVTFRPLDREAMEGICRRVLAERRQYWMDRFGKEMVVPDTLVEHIADRGHAANEVAEGGLGGRVIRRLFSELVENAITVTAEYRPEAYRECGRIELFFEPPGPWVDVVFHDAGSAE